MKNILLENPNCDIDNFRKYLLKFLGNENVKGKRILDLGCVYFQKEIYISTYIPKSCILYGNSLLLIMI